MNDPKNLPLCGVAEIRSISKKLLADVADDVLQGKVRAHQTEKHSFRAYLDYRQGDSSHVVPVRVEAIAYDDRRKAETRGDITFRLQLITGGIACPEAVLPLDALMGTAGLTKSPDSGRRFADYVDGKLGISAGHYYAESSRQGHVAANGDAHSCEESIVINPSDLQHFFKAVGSPETEVSSVLSESRQEPGLPPARNLRGS